MAWWRSLQGQMMLAIAVALLVAQGLSASLIWHEVHQRHIASLVNGFAMRMLDDRAPPPAASASSPAPHADWTTRPAPIASSGSPDDGLRLPRASSQ